MEKINRLKAALTNSSKTNKRLTEQPDKDPVIISKWCANTIQPHLLTLPKISYLLQIGMRELMINKNGNINTIK